MVVSSPDGIKIENSEEIKVNLIKELKFMTKVTRGLYSGIYQDDKEYIKFCKRKFL